jgi:hypothetical protein
MGEMKKAEIMGLGRFLTPEEQREGQGTTKTWWAQEKPDAKGNAPWKKHSEYIPGAANMMGNYGKMFGIGGGEIGKMNSIFNLTSGGLKQGQKTFGNVLGISEAGGMGTHAKGLMDAIVGTMEEAVKNGVNNSDLAEEMAMEIAVVQKANPMMKHIDVALKAQKSQMQMQQEVARGNVSGVGTQMMYGYAQKRVQELVSKGDVNNPFIKQALELGLIKKGQLGSTLDAATLQASIGLYSEQNPLEQRQALNKGLTDYGGGDPAQTALLGRYLQIGGHETVTSSLLQTNAAQKAGLMQKEINKSSRTGGIVNELPAISGGSTQMALNNNLSLEVALLSKPAAKAAQAVHKFNMRMVDIAANSAPAVEKAIQGMDIAMGALATGIGKSMEKITGTVVEFFDVVEKKGTGAAIKNLLMPKFGFGLGG